MRRDFSLRLTWPMLVLALGVLLTGARYYWAAPHEDPVRTTVAASRGDVVATVNALGSVQPHVAAEVGVQVSGRITRLRVGPGAVVTKGQLLAEIHPSILQATEEAGRAQLSSLHAQLAEHQAQQELARQQYERQRQMEADGATRAEDVQTAWANLRVAEARVANLRGQIEQTASRLRGDEA